MEQRRQPTGERPRERNGPINEITSGEVHDNGDDETLSLPAADNDVPATKRKRKWGWFVSERQHPEDGVTLSVTTVRFVIEIVLLLFAGFMAWANVKSDMRDEATRNELHRVYMNKELSDVRRGIMLNDAWARDLDIRLAASGVTVPRRQPVSKINVPPPPEGDD